MIAPVLSSVPVSRGSGQDAAGPGPATPPGAGSARGLVCVPLVLPAFATGTGGTRKEGGR